MYNYDCYDPCHHGSYHHLYDTCHYPISYPIGGYHHCGTGQSFALIVVLFILLIIIGCTCFC
ncbi:YjcZ family sporulation protein [Priestia megaterium]|uniref:YjcZ family sporulation protein n=1 Tax=Priestia megaterium TaxID=1404 RepID=UPI0026E2998D|nr:YjcZ family sporulation protein [Priestia megaterium]MDO6847549.1 YjcZ family sporulation protein [Priestia megaterium]